MYLFSLNYISLHCLELSGSRNVDHALIWQGVPRLSFCSPCIYVVRAYMISYKLTINIHVCIMSLSTKARNL